MRAQLLHLFGPLRGRTETYPKDAVLVGTGQHADVAFPLETTGVAERHAEIVYSAERCCFHLRRVNGRVFVNGNEIEEVILEPDDLVEFGIGGPSARFRIYMEPGAYCKPVRKMLTDAQEVGRHGGATGFVRTFVRDLFTHATLKLKVGFPIVVVGAVALAFWLGKSRGEGAKPTAEVVDRLRAYERELAQFRTRSQEVQDQQQALRKDFEQRARIVDKLSQQDEAIRRVITVHSLGICLVSGEFGFDRVTGDTLTPATDDNGQPLAAQYTGSAFLADVKGSVITNRHVVQPWWNNKDAQPLIKMGLQPALRHLRVYFPGRPAIDVDTKSIRMRTDDIDVAMFTIEATGLSPLPLSRENPDNLRGARILVVGYPAGIDGLMAKADNKDVAEITSNAKTVSDVVNELAKRNAIRPLPTQGSLNDVGPKQFVYDAMTTHGGSGGPVFGPDGTVIAVNFAILESFGGSNFGVPIRWAVELLPPE